MNSRALALLGTVIVESMWMIYAAIMLAVAFLDDWGMPVSLLPLGLAFGCSYNVAKALRRLKDEANRDTVMGLNGPGKMRDLL